MKLKEDETWLGSETKNKLILDVTNEILLAENPVLTLVALLTAAGVFFAPSHREHSIMSVKVQLRRDVAANVAAFTGAQGELIVDTTNNRLVLQDGATAGGFAAAKLSEVVAVSPLTLLAQAAHGGGISLGCLEQTVTLSGATTTSSAQIPNGAILLAVSNRVVAAISGATSYSCGVSGNASQFGSSLGVALGSTNLGLIGPAPFYAATSVLYTAAGGSFTGGQVRMTIHYLLPNVATS